MSDEKLSEPLRQARQVMIAEMQRHPAGAKLTADDRLAIADLAIKAGKDIEQTIMRLADMLPTEQKLLAAYMITQNISASADALLAVAVNALQRSERIDDAAVRLQSGDTSPNDFIKRLMEELLGGECDCPACVIERMIQLPSHVTKRLMSFEKAEALAAELGALPSGTTAEEVAVIARRHLADLPGVTLADSTGEGLLNLAVDWSVVDAAKQAQGATKQ